MTGMSGAGKSTALKTMEDMGYYCVDNLPIPLLEKVVEIADLEEVRYNKMAFGIDIRGSKDLSLLDAVFEKIREHQILLRIVFLDASTEAVIKRYKETRRSHPLAGKYSLEEAIEQERKQIDFLKKEADYVIDTTKLRSRETSQLLEKIFLEEKRYSNLTVSIVSFGFKYGLPNECDLVFDVRFLPNPFYDLELRPKTGKDSEVQQYVMNSEVSHSFLNKLKDMIAFLIPNYIEEGKNRLTIGIGCTGGKHRSVTIAGLLCRYLQQESSCAIHLEHRDINRV